MKITIPQEVNKTKVFFISNRMDLKSYSRTEPHKKATEEEQKQPREEDVRRAIKHFSGMSNDQLMKELARHLARQRTNGKSDEVSRTIERIRPLLSPEQRKRLEEILEKVGEK